MEPPRQLPLDSAGDDVVRDRRDVEVVVGDPPLNLIAPLVVEIESRDLGDCGLWPTGNCGVKDEIFGETPAVHNRDENRVVEPGKELLGQGEA